MGWATAIRAFLVSILTVGLALPAMGQLTPGRSLQPDASLEELRRLFRNPPEDDRIMMRWWWFGPSVEKSELEREMRMMKEGGIGGFEVQPVYPLAPDDPEQGFKNLPYLSDEFLDRLRFVAEKAQGLGMRVDLTLGSGWPYGGPQVPITEAAGSLRIVKTKPGANSRSVPAPSLAVGEELLMSFLVPTQSSKTAGQFTQLTDIHDGRAFLPSAADESGVVLFFISSRTGMQVKRAAVGAEGFVLNHYDKAAAEHYLQNVGDRLMQAFTAKPPYAVFCDSLEVYNSDWTGDFLQEFEKRRGYDLRPHLPALEEDGSTDTQSIRHDWGQTLTELFEERFASPLHEWAKRNRTKLRMQAYGIPPAELSSNALVDLPEGEGAEWQSLSATRWASSASHLYGVPVTSSETWTWLHSPVFRATPLDMKAEADRHFLEGINQLIGHGWPYTPSNVEYPGWRFYAAAVFDEKNPWWGVMPDITGYLQRVSYMLRQGLPVSDVAVYLPNDDAWARFRPGHVNLFETLREVIGTDVVTGLLNGGFNFDFFDDNALRKIGKIDGPNLVLGANRYHIAVLPNTERIPVDTYLKLGSFARAGGILVATRRLPGTAPGFGSPEKDKREIQSTSEQLFQASSAAGRFVADEANLASILSKLATPDLRFAPAAPEIGFVHRKLAAGELYFIANTSNMRQQVDATFRITDLEPEWWNPMTGEHRAAQVNNRSRMGITVPLDLEAYGSRLLMFVSQKASTPPRAASSSPSAIDISHDWRVTFGTGGKSETMNQLRSWTDDDEAQFFSGVATYEKTVTIPPEELRGAVSVQINFGDGRPIPPQRLKAGMQAWLEPPIRETAVVYVNGSRVGSIWCPPYSIEVTSLVHAGENSIRVEVANLALNSMAGHSLPDYRLLNLRYGVRFEAQDMDKVQPIPAGLFGPVRMLFSR